MLDLAKKAVLVGTGMALAATDRIQEVVDQIAEKGAKAGTETRETVAALARKTRETRKTVEEEAEKVMTDFTAFCSLTDEMEDQVEKMVSLIMKKLHIPERQELEEIKTRIEKLEKERFE